MKYAILIGLKNSNYFSLVTRFCLEMYCEGGEMEKGCIIKEGNYIR